MKHSDKTEKIDAALAKCQGQVGHATKNMEQSHFRSNYADLPSVRDAAQKAMSENGIAFVCAPEIREWTIVAEKQMPQVDGIDGALIKRNDIVHKEVMVARITHEGEWYEAEAFLKMKGQDDSPQAFGAASTYARRYLMCALLNITSDGEDDDGEAAEGRASGSWRKADSQKESSESKKRPVMKKAKQKGDLI